MNFWDIFLKSVKVLLPRFLKVNRTIVQLQLHVKWSHFIALFISLCFVLFFPSTQPLHCSRVLNDIFKELKRPHDVFILYKEDRKIKSWLQKTIVIQVLILVVTTSGQWRPVKTLHVEVGVKRFDYHYINKKTKKFSRMIVKTVILH